jgi:hypothetical protein
MVGMDAQIEEVAGETREEFGVVDDRHQLTGISQELRKVKTNLGHARLEVERGIPCPALGAAEPAGLARLGIGERGIDEVGVGVAEHQLVGLDVTRAARLGKEAVARCTLDLGERGDLSRPPARAGPTLAAARS